MGLRPTSTAEVDEARYEIRFGERYVGEEFVRRVETERFVCVEGRVRQTAPETIDLSYDFLRIGGRLESLAVRFELAGVELEHEAWRRGDRLISSTRRFGERMETTSPLPVLVDLGSPLSWVGPALPTGAFSVWAVRPPDLMPRAMSAQAGESGAQLRSFEAGGATIEASWPKNDRWPERVTVERPRWRGDRLTRSRKDELLDSSPFAPRLEGRCPID